MLLKLYRNVFKEHPPVERRELFAKLYKKHGVDLLGVWQNKENPLEYYMLTKYQNEEHYNKFVTSVKSNPDYIEMTNRINEVRLENEITDLLPAE